MSMKKIFSMLCIIFCAAIAKAQTDPQTIKDIETVCKYYLDGGSNGDSVLFSKAFAPDGQMRYMRNDTLMNVLLKDLWQGPGIPA